jgi:5'(3')-deoxyribonucleotidase
MSKRNLFLDFDNCIANSLKAYCDYYKRYYGGNPDWTKVKLYNLRDQCPDVPIEQVKHIFAREYFFKVLQFMPNAYNVLQKLKDKYTEILVSIGTFENISNKSIWVKKNMSFIKKAYFIYDENCTLDKSMIDMSGGIIVDDCAVNLESSNADIKILFDNDFAWNANYSNYNFKTYDFVELYDYLKGLL